MARFPLPEFAWPHLFTGIGLRTVVCDASAIPHVDELDQSWHDDNILDWIVGSVAQTDTEGRWCWGSVSIVGSVDDSLLGACLVLLAVCLVLAPLLAGPASDAAASRVLVSLYADSGRAPC